MVGPCRAPEGWLPIRDFIEPHLSRPERMMRADDFPGTDRQNPKFRHWYRNGWIAVRAIDPETGDGVAAGVDHYIWLDCLNYQLIRARWAIFASVEVRVLATDPALIEQLIKFMITLGRAKEADAYTAAYSRFVRRGGFTDRQWEEARRHLPAKYKFGRGIRK